MSLYKIEKNKLISINEKKHILERDIQKIVGENLLEIMGLKFIEFEFQVSGKRIDILAFDEELNAPVIIELKRGNDKGLFDQGMEYFNILLDRDKKHVFLTTLAQKLNVKSDIKLINWENSRVIFIGKNFTQRQMRAIDFKGIPIELWDYNLYENDLFELKEIGLEKKVDLDINISTKEGSPLKRIKKEFIEYDLDFHYKKGSEKINNLYREFEGKMLIQNNFIVKPTKMYIGFWLNGKLFCDAEFFRNSLQITFRSDDDVLKFNFIKKARGRHGNGDYVAKIDSEEELNILINLLK